MTEEKPADYPDIAHMVAKLVASGTATRGVIIDGAGIGSCMAANKVPGIRAALCYDKASAGMAANTMIQMCLRSVRGS